MVHNMKTLRIGLCWSSLTSYKSRWTHEMGHDLLDEVAKDGEKHEDGQHLVLQPLD